MTRSSGRGMVAIAAIAAIAAVAAATLTVALAGCGATTAGTPSSTAPSTSGSAAGSASDSASRQAWVRGTNVTLTNGTGSAVEVKPYSYSGGEGSYAPLATGASTSALSTWAGSGSTNVTFYFKRPGGGVAALMVHNDAIGSPYTKVCESLSLNDCDSESSFTWHQDFNENQTQNVNTPNGAATFVVTRNADDDDNKNWTVSLTSIS